MTAVSIALTDAASLLNAFSRLAEIRMGGLSERVRLLESGLVGAELKQVQAILDAASVDRAAFDACLLVKEAAARIDDVVHALGISLLLPRILEPGERIEYVSLASGNTGRKFDLATDRRVAEFKFIIWRGGAESIRQNQTFKDHLDLVLHGGTRRKQLYLFTPEVALRFFRGRRAMASVLSKDRSTHDEFRRAFGDTFQTVGAYFAAHEREVEFVDLKDVLDGEALSVSEAMELSR